ncbi:MAG: hypothetical protein FWG18_00555, partial [Alphaproteobacteria bacterium]|nr:hypothetical protein [Alphaproteobacteria bacterium]
TIIADYRYHVIDAVHDNDESIQLYSKIPGFKAGTQKFKPHKFKTDFYDAAMNDPDRKPDEMPMDRMIVLSRDDR